ncbi:peptidylprolyl isomerase [Candidatus Woesearchaeota archaeon]|nr:peptidylprolyl isomerase [Candidatus Woesearchaeota archaeon]
MAVEKGNKVKVDYTGTLEDGTVFDTSTHGDHSHPLEFEAGAGQMIKGFDEAVIGMEVGQEKEITLQPDDAYGQPRSDLVQKLPKTQLPEDKRDQVKEGMTLGVGLPDGQQMPARVVAVDAESLTLDLNHPLAGKVLKFKLKLVECN